MQSKIYAALLSIFILMLFSSNQALGQGQEKTLHDIRLLIQEKNSRTPAQKKMDSQLLQAIREKNGQKMANGVDLLPANVKADNTGKLKVDITADVSDALVTRIETLGGRVIYPSWQYHTIRAEINLSMVETIAAYPEVKFIEPAVEAKTVGSGLIGKKDPYPSFLAATRAENAIYSPITGSINKEKTGRIPFAERAANVRKQLEKYLEKTSKPFTGSVNSEGDRTHRADDTRNTYGYSGQGIRIGVLSDSYNSLGTANADIANGNLPGPGNPLGNTTPVTVVQDITGASDEGRAMLQVVHDIAPQAQLFFATADVSEAGFATNIQALRNAPNNCDIIIDDIFYFDEPVFMDGIVAQAVNTVTASGALYFSSAGNEGNLAKNTSGYFEGDFNDAGSPAFTFPGGAKAGTIHNFGTVGTPINGDIITASGEAYTLNWADATGASGNDYDLFVLSSAGAVKASSTNIQNGTQNPYESITPGALVAGDRLVVFKTTGAAVRAFAINTLRGLLTLATTGQTHGHSSAVNAFSVAATPAAGAFGTGYPTGPYPNAFVASNGVELFTSDGPRRIFYDASGTAITPGNFLIGTSGGTVRNKPDITAADGVSTTLPGTSGLNPFYGTSAAAPHAGAIAALLKSANPALTAAQIRTFLTTTALDIEGAGYDNISGFGIVQAFQAMQAVNPTPVSNVILGTITPTEGSFGNGNGFIDPGELGNLVIQIKNPSLVTATNVNATLSTTTPGVTITQATSSYGSIAPSGNASNTATPYKFGVSSSVSCGTVINFILTVTYGGGGVSPRIFQVNVTVGSQPGASISSILGGTPPTGPGYTSASGQQTGRVSRSGTTSTCAVPKANPGLTTAVGSRQFDAYTFTNTNAAAQCVTVTLTSPNGVNLYTVAYTNAGFVPASPSTNYLADPGSSSPTQTYSFTAPPGQAFTVVVHDINVTPASNSSYTLSVSLANCSSAPVCTPITLSPATIPVGLSGTPYSQVFTATGGSGNYIYSLTGTLPTGLTFSGNTLSGTPTQTGSFPITVIVTDAAGCTGTNNNYTLVINTAGASTISTVAGTPQTALINTAFAIALQAKVLDASNVPVNGANVTFTAPGSGASGTFTGGLTAVVAVTNASGIATAPTFTANGTTGTYNVVATTAAAPVPANFALTNTSNPCSIVCPANIVVGNQTNQCGAIVTFPAPTTTGGCGTVTVTPASGSFFPVGVATTVTATTTSGSSCTFTVKVNDTQFPTLNVPTNITVNTGTGQCTAVVNYTVTATDNCPGVTTTLLSGPASGSSFPIGTTTINYKATDAAGNVTPGTFTVTVNDGQPATITSQPTNKTACAGDNVTFSVGASNAVSYQWQKFDGTAWNNIAGATSSSLALSGVTIALNTSSYRVIVSGACSTQTSTFATLYVNPLPTISLTASPYSALLPGRLTTLTAVVSPTGGSIVWYKDGSILTGFTGLSLANLSVDNIGTYKAVYTDPNGCISTSANYSLTADGTRTDPFVFVYPSPNGGQFQVRFFNQANETDAIRIFDSYGNQVYYRKVTAGSSVYSRIDVDLSRYSGGVYLIEVRDPNSKLIGARRIVISH